jgi:hypothetical protein
MSEPVKFVRWGEAKRAPAQSTPVEPPAPAQPAPEPRYAPAAAAPTPADATPVDITPLPDAPRDEVREWMKLPNAVLDSGVLEPLSAVAQVVYLHMLRLSLGHNRPTCKIGREGLARRTGFSEKTAVKGVRELVAYRLVELLAVDNTSGKRRERGSEYLVSVPAAALAPVDATPAGSTGVRRTGVDATGMKENPKKEEEKELRFVVRERAARIKTAEPGISRGELVTAVLRGLAGEGKEATREDVLSSLAGLSL